MKYFAILLFALCLEATAANQGADRTITWRPWQEWPEFRTRTGDRYLGNGQRAHYLCFEQLRPSTKRIKISMIYVTTETVPDICHHSKKTLCDSQSHQLRQGPKR